jgi:hypothetical protein
MVGHACPGPLGRGDGAPVERYEQSGDFLAGGAEGRPGGGAGSALK